MAKVKSGTNRLSISEKIAVGRDRITALTGNTSVPINQAKLTAYTDAVNNLQTAQSEVGNTQILLTEKYSRQYNADKEYNRQTLVMVSEINSLTDDETGLSTTGFPINETPVSAEPIGSISGPGNVIASMGVNPGEIEIQWRSVKSSQGYNVEYSADAAFADNTTKRKHIGKVSKTKITGLESGSKVWVRLNAIKANDNGPWSDPALTMVP